MPVEDDELAVLGLHRDGIVILREIPAFFLDSRYALQHSQLHIPLDDLHSPLRDSAADQVGNILSGRAESVESAPFVQAVAEEKRDIPNASRQAEVAQDSSPQGAFRSALERSSPTYEGEMESPSRQGVSASQPEG